MGSSGEEVFNGRLGFGGWVHVGCLVLVMWLILWFWMFGLFVEHWLSYVVFIVGLTVVSCLVYSVPNHLSVRIGIKLLSHCSIDQLFCQWVLNKREQKL